MLIDVTTSWAVLIGTANHTRESDLADLPAVRNNLDDLAMALADPDVLGLPNDQIAILSDPSDPATVGKTIRAAGVKAVGTLLVYYAGHGLPDENGQLFLALSSTSTQGLPFDALPFQWVARDIRSSTAATRILILDCCYAGLGESFTMSGTDPVAEQSTVTGTWTLFSSAYDTPSLAPPGARNTAFTGALLDLLNSGDPDGPSELDGETVLRALRQRLVPQGFPRPDQRNSDMGYRIAIARNRAATATDVTGKVRPAQPRSGVPVDGVKGRRATSSGRPQTHVPSQLVMTLPGHSSWTADVAFSPDGRLVASCGGDDKVRLWEVATGAQLHEMTGHFSAVHGVAFSPDGNLLASAGRDGTVRLWKVATGKQTRQLIKLAHEIQSVAFSPDGRLLASAEDDGIVRLWEVAARKQVHKLIGDSGRLYDVAFSPDGNLLACAGDDLAVQLWGVATATQLRTMTGHRNPVWGVAFSPDGRLLASAGRWGYIGGRLPDMTVRLWEVATGKQVRAVTDDPAYDVAFSPDGSLLASAGADDMVSLWEVATGKQVRKLSGHNGEVLGVAFSPDGRLLASAAHDETVRLWG